MITFSTEIVAEQKKNFFFLNLSYPKNISLEKKSILSTNSSLGHKLVKLTVLNIKLHEYVKAFLNYSMYEVLKNIEDSCTSFEDHSSSCTISEQLCIHQGCPIM